ncbi:uncharacterized protein I303_102349 [Kwoniella dejecticola CBS 10117]|uniref:F-box domain-containing protein n=1 Tax=Kwoniella dejecticola CBS 10117 TaxID=1296121 RepID=A0A1A6AB84_9TREE|nr:uncharacterized protein I303_01510 [Kwoniella dejecticola CBS 10117]OBR87308.1 hypothetical protein I303_01510 [Kwoniella dejecticola CBS 10117]
MSNLTIAYDAFQTLLPVHPRILHHLAYIAPTLYLRLSSYYYTKLIPSLYSTFSPSIASLNGLSHKTLGQDQTRKRQALTHVTHLKIDSAAWFALTKATKGYQPFRQQHQGLFPNVKTLELDWYAIKNGSGDWSNAYLPLENTLWFHLKPPLHKLILQMEGVDSGFLVNAIVASLSKLIRYYKPNEIEMIYHGESFGKRLDFDMDIPARIWYSFFQPELRSLRLSFAQPDTIYASCADMSEAISVEVDKRIKVLENSESANSDPSNSKSRKERAGWFLDVQYGFEGGFGRRVLEMSDDGVWSFQSQS